MILPSLWFSETSVNCFLALKAIVQKPFEELLTLKDKLKATKGRFETSTQRPRRHDDFEAIYGLITHEEERTSEDLFHRTYIATWLLRLLKRSPYFPEWVKTPDSAEAIPSDGELYIGSLILHNLMLIQFNAHEVSHVISLLSPFLSTKLVSNIESKVLYICALFAFIHLHFILRYRN